MSDDVRVRSDVDRVRVIVRLIFDYILSEVFDVCWSSVRVCCNWLLQDLVKGK